MSYSEHEHKQGFLGDLASFLESIKNVFNFSIPFLSWLVFVVLILLTITLYLLPIRYYPCLVLTTNILDFQSAAYYVGN